MPIRPFIYNKKVDAVTARWRGRLTPEELNAGYSEF